MSDRALRTKRRVYAAYAMVVALACAGTYFQYREERDLQLSLLTERIHEAFEQLNNIVTSAVHSMHGMQTLVDDFFAFQSHSESRQTFLISQALNTAEGFDGFALDHPRPPLKPEMVGNLTGSGNPVTFDQNHIRELEFAFLLNSNFKEVLESVPHVTKIYYTSLRKFQNMYPWKPSSEARWSPEATSRKSFKIALPENNPDRKPVWSEPHTIEGGPDLAVTLSIPIYEGDAFRGAVSMELALNALSDFVHRQRIDFTTALIVNEADKIIAHPLLIDKSTGAPVEFRDVLPDGLKDRIGPIRASLSSAFVGIGGHLVWRRKIPNSSWDYIVYMEEQDLVALSIKGMLPQGLVFLLLLLSLFFIEGARILSQRYKEARERADEATRAKSIFLATMSHEIRTPMNGVIGMAELLFNSDLSANQRQMMNTIRDSAFSLLRVIDDILDFSKIEAGKMQIENLPISVQKVLEDVGDTLAPGANRKGVQLQISIDPAIPPSVIGDSVRLRQILFNLGGNAIKFTNTEAGRTGKVHMEVICLETKGDSGSVRLEFNVKDNGIGMEESAVQKLFAPFTQADSSTTRRFGGTGLGLSISRSLARLIGGDISLTSSAGVGSTFTVRAPFAVTKEQAAEKAFPDLSDIHIITVIGDRSLDGLVRKYLGHAGCRLDDGSSGVDFESAGGQSENRILITDKANDADEAPFSYIRRIILGDSPGPADDVGDSFQHVVSAYPLKPSSLLTAVASIAGLDVSAYGKTDDYTFIKAIQAPTLEEAAASKELILVADDNPTNLDVIRRQLNMLGYAAECASDGREAYEKVKSLHHGLLLTDCQMPEMDGYELVRRIRADEAESGNHLPVVAITASVMEGEIDKCFEAGMDDCLAKPVEMDRLRKILDRWVPKSAEEGPVGEGYFEASDAEAEGNQKPAEKASSTTKPEGSDECIDQRAIKDVFGDDPLTFSEILQEFIVSAGNIVRDIDMAYEAHDAKALGAAGHKLKSSARAVGAGRLSELCSVLENAGNSGDWETIDRRMPHVPLFFSEVESYVDALKKP